MSRRRSRTWTPRERGVMRLYNSSWWLPHLATWDKPLADKIIAEAIQIKEEKGSTLEYNWMSSDPPHQKLEYAIFIAKQERDYLEYWVPSEENPNILVILKHPNVTRRIV